MALSSWNALYTSVEQKFMRKRQWRQLHMLKVFVQHADPFGLSYPGTDLITELTGIGTIKQINEILQWLVDGEYVKVWETWDRKRRKWDRDYQVSPLVMYIREELQGYCENVWVSGDRDLDFEADVIKRNGQPTSEPESEPTSVNQHQNQHHHPAKYAAKQQGQAVPPVTTGKTARKRKTGTSRSTEKENPQAGGPVPPEKTDLRKYQSPLPSGEDRAQDLTLMFRMRISQARSLVANWSAETIDAAAHAVMSAMEKGQCNNPAGLLTYLVKRGGSSPDDKQLYDTKSAMERETARLSGE